MFKMRKVLPEDPYRTLFGDFLKFYLRIRVIQLLNNFKVIVTLHFILKSKAKTRGGLGRLEVCFSSVLVLDDLRTSIGVYHLCRTKTYLKRKIRKNSIMVQ